MLMARVDSSVQRDGALVKVSADTLTVLLVPCSHVTHIYAEIRRVIVSCYFFTHYLLRIL